MYEYHGKVVEVLVGGRILVVDLDLGFGITSRQRILVAGSEVLKSGKLAEGRQRTIGLLAGSDNRVVVSTIKGSSPGYYVGRVIVPDVETGEDLVLSRELQKQIKQD